MRKKRGQVSVEFALLIGFITFLLIAIIGIAYYYSGTAKTQIKVNTVDKAGKKIAEAADSIYFLGPPSKATIQVTIPESVYSVEFLDTSPFGIHFKVTIKGTARSDMIYDTQGRIEDGGGVQTSLSKAGFKTLTLEAKNDSNGIYVEVTKTNQ
ncbi:MAG: hypothetical protein JSW08_00815 [archaeon]|nr:MAG: hypothetical protein JSW08_00815 [archaeon]